MRPFAITIGVLAALGAGMSASGARAENPASADTALAARLGQSIEASNQPAKGHAVAWGSAVGVVAAPVQVVSKVLVDYAHYNQFLPHFKTSRVLSRRGDDALVYMEAGVIKNTVTLWAQMRISAHDEGNRRIIEGRMLRGNMDAFVARWELTPVADNTRTLVRFKILVDPGLPLPNSVFNHENLKSAGRALRALRQRVLAKGAALADNR